MISSQLLARVNKNTIILLLICVISLSLRFWLLDKRWINPDEGAHLMDAVLILDGKIPKVDFNSRQPLYSYTIAAFLKLFGVNYISGRLFPMTCSILVGLMILLMALMLFDKKVAILSATIYWLLPLELMNSVIVKTQPFVLLLTCLSLYAIMLFSKKGQGRWLIFAGVFSAMGFYVRQSALIVPLIVFVFLLLFHKGLNRKFFKCFGLFLAGYFGFNFLVMIYYSRFMPLDALLGSHLSPVGFIIKAGKKLFFLFGLSLQESNNINPQADGISNGGYGLYVNYIRQAINLHSFLLVGFVFSCINLCRRTFSGNKPWTEKAFAAQSLLYLWVFFLCMAYGYFFYARGFFIDYFREFLPPLVILFSAWLRHSVPAFETDGIPGRFILGGICLGAILYFSVTYYGEALGMRFFIPLSVGFFTLFYFIGKVEFSKRRVIFSLTLLVTIFIVIVIAFILKESYFSGKITQLALLCVISILPLVFLKKDRRSLLNDYARYISLAMVLGAFILSINYSAKRLNLPYDSVWSPESLEKTAAYLNAHTQLNDTVMSGAVIWEFQGHRRPFLNISHPLAFAGKISKEEKDRLQFAILTEPPEIIILDSVTEQTYFRQVPWLRDFINSEYNLVYTAEPARHPVEVYQKKSSL